MPLPLLKHSALALFAHRTRIPTSARGIGFCVICVCISSSSSSFTHIFAKVLGCKPRSKTTEKREKVKGWTRSSLPWQLGHVRLISF